MNAQELYECVKDVPREAWPEGIIYDERTCAWWPEELSRHAFKNDHAAIMFEASMARWLFARGSLELSIEPCVRHMGRIFNGETLVEALSSACQSLKEPGR